MFNALREWKLACPRLKPAEGKGEGRLWLVFPNGNGKVESHANIRNRGFTPLQVKIGMVEPANDENGRPVIEPVRDERRKPIVANDGDPVLRQAMRAKYGLHDAASTFAAVAARRIAARLYSASCALSS